MNGISAFKIAFGVALGIVMAGFIGFLLEMIIAGTVIKYSFDALNKEINNLFGVGSYKTKPYLMPASMQTVNYNRPQPVQQYRYLQPTPKPKPAINRAIIINNPSQNYGEMNGKKIVVLPKSEELNRNDVIAYRQQMIKQLNQ